MKNKAVSKYHPYFGTNIGARDIKGLSKWLPKLPEGASREKTKTNTFLAGDGYWYTGKKLTHHFKESYFWGVNRSVFIDAIEYTSSLAMRDLRNALARDLFKGDNES